MAVAATLATPALALAAPAATGAVRDYPV